MLIQILIQIEFETNDLYRDFQFIATGNLVSQLSSQPKWWAFNFGEACFRNVTNKNIVDFETLN